MRFKKYVALMMTTVSVAVMAAVSPFALSVYAEETVKTEAENEKIVADQEKTEEKSEKTETEQEKTEPEKTETEQEKTEPEKTETEQEKSESETEKKETEQEKSETETEKKETEQQKTESETEKTETEQEKTESETEKKESEQEQTEAEAEQKEEPVLTEEEKAAKEAADAKKALQDDPNHVHNYRWIAKMNDSEVAEGTMNYMCDECGKIWFFSPASPYVCFEGETAHRIETAAEGEQVKVKTSHFINFDKQVMKALAERPDVSLYVSFLDGEYKGNRVSFIIPAGEDTMSLVDENGYCGFRFLGNKYGLTLEQAAEVAEPAKEEGETSAQAENAEKSSSEIEESADQVG